jgi:hypothetical protein
MNINLEENYLQPIRVVKKLIPSVSGVYKRIHEGKVRCVIAHIHLFPCIVKGVCFLLSVARPVGMREETN